MHLLHAEPRGDAGGGRDAGRGGPARARVRRADEAAACWRARSPSRLAAGERSALLLDLARAEHGLGGPEALDHVLAASETRPTTSSARTRRSR